MNTDISREAALQLLKTWPFSSGTFCLADEIGITILVKVKNEWLIAEQCDYKDFRDFSHIYKEFKIKQS